MKTSTMLLFSGIAILPGPAAAQTDASRDTPPINIQIAEARGTPFHARLGAHTSLVPGRLAGPFLPHRPEAAAAPDSSADPLFGEVLLPTLLATMAADALGGWLFFCAALAERGSQHACDLGAIGLALGVGIPVAGSALAASRFGARLKPALLGSVAGLGLGWLAVLGTGFESSLVAALVFSSVHATATTLGGLAFDQ